MELDPEVEHGKLSDDVPLDSVRGFKSSHNYLRRNLPGDGKSSSTSSIKGYDAAGDPADLLVVGDGSPLYRPPKAPYTLAQLQKSAPLRPLQKRYYSAGYSLPRELTIHSHSPTRIQLDLVPTVENNRVKRSRATTPPTDEHEGWSTNSPQIFGKRPSSIGNGDGSSAIQRRFRPVGKRIRRTTRFSTTEMPPPVKGYTEDGSSGKNTETQGELQSKKPEQEMGIQSLFMPTTVGGGFSYKKPRRPMDIQSQLLLAAGDEFRNKKPGRQTSIQSLQIPATAGDKLGKDPDGGVSTLPKSTTTDYDDPDKDSGSNELEDLDYDDTLHKHKLMTTVRRTHVYQRVGDGPEFRERWNQERRIGAGTFGSVFLQRKQGTTDVRAVKKLSKDNWEKLGENVKRELTHLISVMDRPDLFVKFLGWYENDDFVFYAMEYVEHGDLGKYIATNDPWVRAHAREISRQLLEGLVVLHERGICHRDLKPQNVLIASLSPIHVKLADFGIAKSEVGSIMMTTGVGTMGYIAPEVLRFLPQGSSPGRQYSNAIDMWAFGCLVHVLLTMEQPFSLDGRFDMGTFATFCRGQTSLAVTRMADSESDLAIDFVKGLLVLDARKRMSAAEALDHEWLIPPAERGLG